jgi:hypothetical protein
MTKEILGLNKAATIKSIVDISKEKIVYGELLKGNERVSEVEITEPFNKDRVNELVRLRLVTSEEDVIHIYFCSDCLYADVNGRETYRKMFNSKTLNPEEQFVALEMKQNSKITSEIKIDDIEYEWFGIRLGTNYGEIYTIIVEGKRFEMTKNSDNFNPRAKGMSHSTFILADLIYNNECFCDEHYNGGKQKVGDNQ